MLRNQPNLMKTEDDYLYFPIPEHKKEGKGVAIVMGMEFNNEASCLQMSIDLGEFMSL